MANKSNELEELVKEAVRLQAEHAQRKAQAFLDLLTKDTEQQNVPLDDLTPTQRELVETFRARWGWSEEEARYHLKLWGG